MVTNSNNKSKIAIVGAGAAGLLAAGKLCESGYDVTLFDSNAEVGKKLAITGKGRCNVTNASELMDFLQNVPTNPRFLFSALSNFTYHDTVDLFENQLEVPLKLERGNRYFPVSDKAMDIVKALKKYANKAHFIHEKVKQLIVSGDSIVGIKAQKDYLFDVVLMATGGCSYPKTGSDGSGYYMLAKIGHTIVEPKPSLVPIETIGNICPQLMGLSLKNVSLSIKKDDKCIYDDFGEMLFTHFGISGPMVLSASAHLHSYDISTLKAYIDLKPALDENTLHHRLILDFQKNNNKDFINVFQSYLPQKMIEPFINMLQIDPHKKANSITKDERENIVYTLKHFPLSLKKFRPIEEAIVTSGGVSVKEIDSKTMMSKKFKGLFLAGEVIDVDAYTGGFNLQIAFSTANLASQGIINYIGEQTNEL